MEPITDADLKEMHDFVALQSKEVQQNIEIVTAADMNAPYALHIDKNTPGVFVPRMPKSAAPSENDSCARVTVACTALGCFIGYFRGENDTMRGSVKIEGEHDHFRGGYYISKMDFNHALKPNAKMVMDAESSEELWLVPYNKDHIEYKPVVVGKIFVSALTYLPASGNHPSVSYVFYLENNDPNGMWLDRKNKVDVGYYRIDVDWPTVYHRSIYNDKIKITKVEKEEFEKQKNLRAAMLEFSEVKNTPSYLKW